MREDQNARSLQKQITVLYTNCDSLLNKIRELKVVTVAHQPSIIALTDVKPKNCLQLLSISEISILGYCTHSNIDDQEDSNRGIVIYVKEELSLQVGNIYFKTDFNEQVWISIKLKKSDELIFGCLYRSPKPITDNHSSLLKLIEVATQRNSHTVNTLRGKLRNENKENTLYDLDNKIIENSEYANVINECWQQIYQKHQNDIEEEWSTNKRNQYIHRHEHEIKNGSIVINNINIPAILEEHFDMVEQVHRTNIPSILEEHFDMVEQINCSKAMSKPDITCNELKLHIRKIKNRRAPGPDNIKPDLLKIIGEDDYCIKELTHGMNNILDKKDKLPSTWTESKTVLIPKKNKPTVKDLRPIALTNATYKLFMGILKSKMEKHIREIRQDSEVQAGFTRHRRIADNLFILDYCVATSFKNRKEMYLISVDFAKAFDSIKRSTLIFALKKYKIHPQIIDVIAQIYSNDQTHIYFNNMFQCDIDVTSGIRQGCTESSNLFLLITYIIIEKLYENLDGLKTNICKIVALFFADDGMIIMQSLKETIDSIKILTDIAQDCGLSINKAKSNILIYNSKEQPNHIEGIPVTNKMNYLGVTVQNKKDCFKLHKEEWLNKARHRSNLMHAVIAKSCNKILIGKTYWKNAALPSIMHGTEIVCFTEKQISDLQTEENKAFRYNVNARKCTAISALRSEMGASLQKTRDMKTKILFLRHILTDNNLMKEILIHQLEAKKPTKWIKQIKEYLEELQ